MTMLREIAIYLILTISLLNPAKLALAQEEAITIMDLPMEGYYIAPDDYAIDGLLFEGNQLVIYVKDAHELSPDTAGTERLQWLRDFHSFPHPDLGSYSKSVRDRYLAQYDLDYDLKATYEEIADLITADMSQAEVQDLINNRIPGIYYTEKDGYSYYTIAKPTVIEENGQWKVQLFGEDVIDLQFEEGRILDQEGIIYEFLAGIKPN
ncbi:hypothetical protein ACF3NG_01225 [Aerococcaceae bacterium WGS1372]